MELLETDDPIKGKLLQRASRHREELEEEVSMLSERTEKIITNALIVGGALALGYILVRQFSKSKSKKSRKAIKPMKAATASVVSVDEEEEVTDSPMVSAFTQIGTAVASQATMFLLSLAKEKLSEYLQAQSQQQKKDA